MFEVVVVAVILCEIFNCTSEVLFLHLPKSSTTVVFLCFQRTIDAFQKNHKALGRKLAQLEAKMGIT